LILSVGGEGFGFLEYNSDMPKDFYSDINLQKGFDKKIVEKAYKFAKKAHLGQKRKSGDPYITHPVAVARILLELGMSSSVVAAAFLHDVVEDSEVKIDEIEKKFGQDIAYLVKGVTGLTKVDFSTYSSNSDLEEAHIQAKNENMRALFMAMAEDVRVVMIKLADRLHNMRTIKALSKKDQQRIAHETLNIFSPLALRLGMGEVKGMLEDLAFPIAYPEEYKKLKKEANRRYKAADRYTLRVKRIIADELKKSGVKAEIEGRAKHIYSLYKKITRTEIDWDFDKIYDLVAIRIITENEEDCYKVLGIIHGKYRPLPNYVRDYIAAPKPNGYRSIHTTVFGPEGKMVEIQIRTRKMHEEAEYGVASHLHYTLGKSAGKSDKQAEKGFFADQKQTDFLRRIKEWQASIGSTDEFLEGLRLEFLDDRIYVFSPGGDIFDLPVGATPVDFAYEIHSNVGDSCTGAKVNGRIVPLETELKTRDVVEIITGKNSFPKRGWLDFVKTSKAKQHIRSYLRKFDYEKNKEEGRIIVEKEFELLGYNLTDISEANIKEALSEGSSFKSIADLFAAVGEGLVTRRQAVKILLGKPFIVEPMKKASKRPKKALKYDFSGMKINIAPCCNPKKGDMVIGYVTRGKGLSIHKDDCSNLKHLEKQRLFNYNPWLSTDQFPIKVEVIIAKDRIGLVRDITAVIAKFEVNIEEIGYHHKPGSVENRLIFAVTLSDMSECDELLREIAKIENVIATKRLN